jgi:hypothetical protein
MLAAYDDPSSGQGHRERVLAWVGEDDKPKWYYRCHIQILRRLISRYSSQARSTKTNGRVQHLC